MQKTFQDLTLSTRKIKWIAKAKESTFFNISWRQTLNLIHAKTLQQYPEIICPTRKKPKPRGRPTTKTF